MDTTTPVSLDVRKKGPVNEEIITLLVGQITKFQYAANLYQTFGLWAKGEGLLGSADYLFKQAKERRHSAKYLHEFVDSVGGCWNSEAVEAALPESDITDLASLFDLALEEEVKITDNINSIMMSVHANNQFVAVPYILEMLEFQIGEEDEARDHLKIAQSTKDVIVADMKIDAILKAKKGK